MERLTDRFDDAVVGVVTDDKADLISIFDTVENPLTCVMVQNAIDKLAEYEDAEEQGLLIKLPCKVGDTVFVIDKTTGINRWHITGIACNNWNNDWYVQIGLFGKYHTSEFGKTVFPTKEAAEQALKGGVLQ